MKNNLKRKLILSIFSLASTAVCLTSTTYAWFARNENAWTDDFTLEMGANDDLAISIDGVNFGNTLTNNDIKKGVASKILGKAVNSITDEDIANNPFALQPVSTANLVDFTTVDAASSVDEATNSYIPSTAKKDTYITFDAYFRVSGNTSADYNLTLVSKNLNENKGLNGECYVKNNTAVKPVKLDNKLVSCDGKEYNSGDELTVNPLNAIRIGFIKDETEASKPVIYEPYAGIGSYAIKDETEAKYNPTMNPMLTYFNNKNDVQLNPLEPNDIYKNTEKDFNGEVSLGKFKTDANGEYNTIKITVAIWLEGYDADYFYGVNASSFTFFLNFVKVDVGGNN